MLPQCLSSELPLPCVLLAVELLSLLVDHDSFAQQLCFHSGKAGQAGSQLSCHGREGLAQGQVQSLSGGFCTWTPGSSEKGDAE